MPHGLCDRGTNDLPNRLTEYPANAERTVAWSTRVECKVRMLSYITQLQRLLLYHPRIDEYRSVEGVDGSPPICMYLHITFMRQ